MFQSVPFPLSKDSNRFKGFSRLLAQVLGPPAGAAYRLISMLELVPQAFNFCRDAGLQN